MDIRENEGLDAIEIIDDFNGTDLMVAPEFTGDVDDIKPISMMDHHENQEIVSEEVVKPIFESVQQEVVDQNDQDSVQPVMITQFQQELKEIGKEDTILNTVEPVGVEPVQPLEPSTPTVVEAGVPSTETNSEIKIDHDLIHSSLENTMLLNKELLRAAAESTVRETRDEDKENKKGIIFIIVIFACLIIFTALIPFILQWM